MPTTVQVKVNTVGDTTRGDYNYKEVTGYDHTNNKGFKKMFFAEKKDGGPTKNAETADTLVKGDWVEFVLDDSSYNNVQTIRKISEPAGAGATPDQGKASGGGSNRSADKMSKAEWAEKDRKKAVSVGRSVALKASALLFSGKGATKAIVDSLEKLTFRMEAYLTKGDFSAELDPDEPATGPDLKTPDNKEEGPADQEGPGPNVSGPEDDDIPF